MIHNPKEPEQKPADAEIANTVQCALETLGMTHAKMFVTKLVKEENVAALRKKKTTLEDLEVHVSHMEKRQRIL